MEIDQKHPYHSIEIEETLEKVSGKKEGLSSEEAEKRQEEFGENKIKEKGGTNPFKLFIKQFKDFLILILFIAAGIAWWADQMADVYIILAVILFNAIMGFTQEYKAEKAVQAIQNLEEKNAIVLRDGKEETIPIEEVVPGDIMILKEGNSIPADGRLIEAKELRTSEASLTGESMPIDKNTETVDEDASIGDRTNMAWRSTNVVNGNGKAVVTAIGNNSEIGQIAQSMGEMEMQDSNFRKKTKTLGKQMAGVAIITSIIIFALGYWYRDFEFQETLLVTIAVLVSIIPEGLPAVISIVLAIGANRMAKQNVIIREFTATEMMGSVSVILADKTGTLTQSILVIKKIFTGSGKEVAVSGTGYQLEGEFKENDEELNLDESPVEKKLLAIAAFCNDATIKGEEEEKPGEESAKKDKEEKSDSEEKDKQEEKPDSKERKEKEDKPKGEKEKKEEKSKPEEKDSKEQDKEKQKSEDEKKADEKQETKSEEKDESREKPSEVEEGKKTKKEETELRVQKVQDKTSGHSKKPKAGQEEKPEKKIQETQEKEEKEIDVDMDVQPDKVKINLNIRSEGKNIEKEETTKGENQQEQDEKKTSPEGKDIDVDLDVNPDEVKIDVNVKSDKNKRNKPSKGEEKDIEEEEEEEEEIEENEGELKKEKRSEVEQLKDKKDIDVDLDVNPNEVKIKVNIKSGTNPDTTPIPEEGEEEEERDIEEEEEEEKEEEEENEDDEKDKKNKDQNGDEEDQGPEVTGDPTEVAMLVASKKARIKQKDPFSNYKLLDDIPFKSEQKFRASLVKTEDGREIFAIGAPERILELSTQFLSPDGPEDLNDDKKQEIQDKMDEWADQAMRVLALGFKKTEKESIEPDDVQELVWVGITGIIDPPRKGVPESIEECKTAGIRVMMVTGDHKKTAAAIARDIGILEKTEGDEGKYPPSITTKELDVEDEKFDEYIENINVFARMNPDTKLKIAERLQAKDTLIAMTGDGVNDAPALKRADVGIAMGQRGTDVAKDASEIVLQDDNFSSIVNAIREGRIVFTNVKITSYFLLTTNFAFGLAFIFGISLGFPLLLTAVQILYVNLVTAGIIDVALATEPGHGEIMHQPPVKKSEPILKADILPFLFLVSAVIVTLTLLTFQYYLPQGEIMARTATFIIISMTQIFNVFNMRSLQKSIFEIGVFTNKWVNWAVIGAIALQFLVIKVPFLRNLMGFEDLPIIDFVVMMLISTVIVGAGELYKYLKFKKNLF